MIEQIISRRLQIPLHQVQGTVRLLREGATIPFISRYRKEATGSLDEVQVASVKEWLDRLTELETRKQTVLTTIEGQGRLTPELRRRIAECWDAVELEDIYLPYKPKRRTRATVARERGLEPLAEIILAQQSRNVVQQARRFVSAEVPTPEEALAGACDIVAERISEDERARNTLRRTFAREGIVHSKLVKGKETEGAKYADYFDAATPLRSISSHRFLAMRRGEEEGILKIAVDVDAEHCIESLRRLFVRPGSATREWMEAAVADSFKRLIRPSIETEQLAAAKEKADDEAIRVFAENLRQLLLSSPLGQKRVVAIDPGFRTGCKVVALDAQGNLLHHTVISPPPPQSRTAEAAETLRRLAARYRTEAMAIGDGTAGRETEQFVRGLKLQGVELYTVSEDGLTWTVTIREDAVFTDGEPLTAADVAFTYNTVKSSSSVNDFTMLDFAEAADDTTVVFHMTRPFSIWPYTMAIVGIVPEHAYDPTTYGANPIGSGRYELVQWDRGQQVILEANPDYYGEAPEIQRVVILFMEEDAAFLAAQAGQVDVAYTSATYSDQTIDGYTLAAYDSVDNRGFNLPAVPAGTDSRGRAVGNDFTADVRVRRAINIGIDRQEMIDHVLNGHGSPAYSVCDNLPWYNPASEVSYDPEGAAALLDEAGWLLDDDGYRYKDGIRAELDLLYSTGDSVRQALCADFAGQLEELGIACTLEGVGWDTAYDRALSQPLIWGWGAHTPMELYNLYHTIGDTSSAQYSPYANPAVDRYMDQALASTDLEASYELWQLAQWDGTAGVTQEGDIPWVWLVNVDHLYWVRDGLRIAEQKIHPHGHGWSIVNNVDRWSWELPAENP
mgnify:CR=1 FL=1